MLPCFCVSVWCIVALCLSGPAHAQDADPLQARIMQVVREAMRPALPYPDTDASGAVPANNSTAAPWMVRPLAAGDRSIEVIANPLNEANQARAARAMAEIENAIQNAQRRSQLQYERAVAEARRTGRSQDVDGVTLSDEGVAGARIDAESHVLVAVEFNQPMYTLALPGSVEPSFSRQVVIPGATAIVARASHVYRERTDRGDEERFAAAESLVMFGIANVAFKRTSDTSFEVSGAGPVTGTGAARSVAIRLSGNDVLIAEILRKANWQPLLELLK